MTLAEAIAQLNTSRHEMFNQWGAGNIDHAASQAVIYKQKGKKKSEWQCVHSNTIPIIFGNYSGNIQPSLGINGRYT